MNRKIVFVNQAVNFLTVDIVNSFAAEFDDVSLITGNIHTQGTELSGKVKIKKIIKYNDKNIRSKILGWVYATIQIYFILLFQFRNHEVFFISIPPMSYWVMLLLKNKFSLLIWDVYPDVLKIFGFQTTNIFYRLWRRVNIKLFKKAHLIFTIGERMAVLISQYVDINKLKIINLWTTFENFIPVPKDDNFFIKENKVEGKFIVQYSGNIGLGHNVELLVEIANLLKDKKNIVFMIIGKGERMPKIKDMVKEYKLENFIVLPFQPDNVFPYSISAADLGVVILDSKISYGSIPNKTYNLMTAGKPILYISSMESELVLYKNKYKNGNHFEATEINSIAQFVSDLADDLELQKQFQKNSLNASLNFTRKNSTALIDEYKKTDFSLN